MIGFLVVHMIVGLVMAPETRNKSLEEIQIERYGTTQEEKIQKKKV